jgi:hypothetical protein
MSDSAYDNDTASQACFVQQTTSIDGNVTVVKQDATAKVALDDCVKAWRTEIAAVPMSKLSRALAHLIIKRSVRMPWPSVAFGATKDEIATAGANAFNVSSTVIPRSAR